MVVEQLSPWTRRGLRILGFAAIGATVVYLDRMIRRNPFEHPDNNKPLGDKVTSKSMFGYRAKLLVSQEELIEGPDVVRLQESIVSGQDILSPLYKGRSFKTGSGIHLKGAQRFLRVQFGKPVLAVSDTPDTFINYQLPDILPGLKFHIFNELGLSRVATVISYAHPTIGLEIVYKDPQKQEPQLQFAPVRP